jgi:hypothetical protein
MDRLPDIEIIFFRKNVEFFFKKKRGQVARENRPVWVYEQVTRENRLG